MFVATQSLLMPAVAHYVANMVQISYAYWRGIPELSTPALVRYVYVTLSLRLRVPAPERGFLALLAMTRKAR
jgi:hypothetical protein